MLYREIIYVCSQIHTKHINTLCGQNVELLNIKVCGTLYSNLLTYSNRTESPQIPFYTRHPRCVLNVHVSENKFAEHCFILST
jgi:hypothetical protein